MPKLTQSVADALDYFVRSAIQRNAPASELSLKEAEHRIGVIFPPSMRKFLQVHNGVGLIDCRLLSVEEAEKLTQNRRWKSKQWLPVARDAGGNAYVLLLNELDARGEHPVAKIDHETEETFVVASCYERFVWFLIDRLQREFEPDGSSKGLWDYPEDEDEDWQEPSFPWPYEDKAWIEQHDPQMTHWLNSSN